MLEESLKKIIIEVEQQIKVINIRLKCTKKDIKQIEKLIKENNYIDIDKAESDKLCLEEELNELGNRLYKIKKILYRLNVCLSILNNEEN